MDVLEKLTKLLKETGLTRYRLSKQCNVPEETLTGIFRRGNVPTIYTLELICKGLNITLSQFFAENDMIELTPDLKELYNEWKFLTPRQKNITLQLVKELKDKK